MGIGVIWLLVKQFKTPILITVGVLSVWGALAYWGHTKYEEGFRVGHLEAVAAKKELKERTAVFEAKVIEWNAMVQKQQKELDDAIAKKEEVTKRNLEDLFKQQKKNTTKRISREKEIKANIKLTDTVTVPSEFERVYNDAVKGSALTDGDKGNIQVPENRPSLIGETKTFEALAFTQVVVGNVEAYNELATQCGKLIDTVTELEATYGANIEGSEGQASTDGGDVPDGVAGDRLADAGGAI